ncbi:inositol-3-phosphate synthase [Runella slithyformis]|uniref:Inositol-3-phosphate synthase n=1 Tax=Runella slithyformis (strain ATCC 29530 / DSM 19594 / LMG 11500 / NCIMB 11436 / LSU 4) TaxID=761193 RepID=A0A7U3ZRG5_RUNSL|nr:inositol-3-phosphate synthase [Runella slithyformis]AEI52005.1 Inositol-3-phosphate synthase [Runella slithyformis DSM 19594]
MQNSRTISAPTGKLGVLLPGMGAVATTFAAGVIASRKGLAHPTGSLTQTANIRLGKRTEHRSPKIRDFVPLASLDQLVFGGWDIYSDNMYQAALKAGVLERSMVESIREELENITPMKAVFDKRYAKNLEGENVKTHSEKWALIEELLTDIENFKNTNGCDRLVMVWCGSTEIYHEAQEVHSSLAKFEEGLRTNDPDIAPSMMYAYAALKSGVPFAMGAPNLCLDIPALEELALLTNTPIAGKDFKTGQTLMKTIVAPGLRARALGVRGWFSTNILGNRDGLVLDAPENFKTKEVSKGNVLDGILNGEQNPELWGDIHHKVRIEYYPPLGDNKEGWDNIDIFGWMGYQMQIKINFLCRDSILAAPIVLDLALFLDLAKRAELAGIQEWLSFYWKAPQTLPELEPIHDLFKQLEKLENTLRYLMGEELITNLGMDYYQSVEEDIRY